MISLWWVANQLYRDSIKFVDVFFLNILPPQVKLQRNSYILNCTFIIFPCANF